ncbi:MAG: flagellar basal-body MS-ring/collar protein FliF [Actinomycetes bacterium]
MVTASVDRGRRMFAGFTGGQKTVTVVAVLALVAGGLLFSQWLSRPSYSPLFSNLSPTDASAIVDKLSTSKIPYQLADGGATILVPANQVYAQRLAMAGDGLPASTQSGYSLLDKQGITTSQFVQQVTYQRALSGELAKTIEAISGVTSAVVQLAIPQQDAFAVDSPAPSASVLVATGPGVTLTPQQVQAIVNLVSSSVVGMSPGSVSVTDANGDVLAAPGSTGVVGAANSAQQQQTLDYQNRLAASLTQMLDQVVGAGHAQVTVTAQLDFDATRTTTESFVQPPKTAAPLSSSSTTETYKGSGTPVGGVLGPGNIAVPNGTGGASTYSKSSSTVDNAVGKVVQVSQAAPGSVQRLGIAVLLDSKAAPGVSTAQIQSLVSAAAGVVPTRGDTVQVATLPFDTTAAAQAQKALAQAASAAQRASLFSMAKTAGLVLVVLAIAAAVLLSGRRRRPESSGTDPDSPVAPGGGPGLPSELETVEVRALRSGASVPALAPAPRPGPDLAALGAARDDIASLVERQPEEVAALLRGWLADRRS